MVANNTKPEDVLIEAFDLDENEVFEARYNLLGFFNVLNKINRRLINNENIYGEVCPTCEKRTS